MHNLSAVVAAYVLVALAILLLAGIASLMAGYDFDTKTVREIATLLDLPAALPASWLGGAPDELVEALSAAWGRFDTGEWQQLLEQVPDSHGAAELVPVAFPSPPMYPRFPSVSALVRN